MFHQNSFASSAFLNQETKEIKKLKFFWVLKGKLSFLYKKFENFYSVTF